MMSENVSQKIKNVCAKLKDSYPVFVIYLLNFQCKKIVFFYFFFKRKIQQIKTVYFFSSFIASDDESVSNMAIMEVNLPSGFVTDLDQLPTDVAGVKKVETQNNDTLVVIYFDNLSTTKTSVKVYAYRTNKVADLKPTAVTVYDYYDTCK